MTDTTTQRHRRELRSSNTAPDVRIKDAYNQVESVMARALGRPITRDEVSAGLAVASMVVDFLQEGTERFLVCDSCVAMLTEGPDGLYCPEHGRRVPVACSHFPEHRLAIVFDTYTIALRQRLIGGE